MTDPCHSRCLTADYHDNSQYDFRLAHFHLTNEQTTLITDHDPYIISFIHRHYRMKAIDLHLMTLFELIIAEFNKLYISLHLNMLKLIIIN
jgi:hypothetical protein